MFFKQYSVKYRASVKSLFTPESKVFGKEVVFIFTY